MGSDLELPAPSQPPNALPLQLAQMRPCLLFTVPSLVQHVTPLSSVSTFQVGRRHGLHHAKLKFCGKPKQ